MSIPQPIKQILLTLAQENSEISALWLYGSRARGTHEPSSDYDLAVMFADYEEDPTERRLRPEILALNWQQVLQSKNGLKEDISIVDIDIIPVPLAFTVVSDNNILFARDEFKLMMKEQNIMSKWEIDFLYHARQYA